MGSLLALGTTAFAQEPAITSSLTTPEPAQAAPTKKAKANGLATQTEILAGQDEAPMLTPNSLEDLQGAIAMYEEMVAGGGWQQLPMKTLKKGAKGDAVVAILTAIAPPTTMERPDGHHSGNPAVRKAVADKVGFDLTLFAVRV